MRGFEVGFNEVAIEKFQEDGKYPYVPFEESKNQWGYENAPIVGIIIEAGNYILKNNQTSRQGKIPLFHEERCIHCGLCEITCPDYCFKFIPKEDTKKSRTQMFNIGLDYQY